MKLKRQAQVTRTIWISKAYAEYKKVFLLFCFVLGPTSSKQQWGFLAQRKIKKVVLAGFELTQTDKLRITWPMDLCYTTLHCTSRFVVTHLSKWCWKDLPHITTKCLVFVRQTRLSFHLLHLRADPQWTALSVACCHGDTCVVSGMKWKYQTVILA